MQIVTHYFREHCLTPLNSDLTFILFKPISNLLFPDLYSLMVVGITFFKMFQKTLYDLTSSRKDRQTNQDK